MWHGQWAQASGSPLPVACGFCRGARPSAPERALPLCFCSRDHSEQPAPRRKPPPQVTAQAACQWLGRTCGQPALGSCSRLAAPARSMFLSLCHRPPLQPGCVCRQFPRTWSTSSRTEWALHTEARWRGPSRRRPPRTGAPMEQLQGCLRPARSRIEGDLLWPAVTLHCGLGSRVAALGCPQDCSA